MSTLSHPFWRWIARDATCCVSECSWNRWYRNAITLRVVPSTGERMYQLIPRNTESRKNLDKSPFRKCKVCPLGFDVCIQLYHKNRGVNLITFVGKCQCHVSSKAWRRAAVNRFDTDEKCRRVPRRTSYI